MIRPRRYFPWKIVGHYYGHLLGFVLAVLLAAGFSIRYFVFNTFLNARDIPSALGQFDEYLTGLGLSLFILCALFIAWSGRFYFRPLGRLLQRARELRRMDFSLEESLEEDIGEDEPGEWADLERALGRLHKDLRFKTEALAREREELTALISAVSDAILAIDRNEAPLFFNSQFALLFGVKNPVLKNLRLGEIFRAPDVLQAFRSVIADGVGRTVDLSLHTSRHNIPRNFALSVAPLRNKEDNAVYGAVGIFHDVTELKQAEQIRIEFVGNASHELRTPLTSVKGYVETLKDDVKVGRYDGFGSFLDIISRNVDRLIFLVNDLLDLSTIESGAELLKTVVSTREVSESVLRQLEGKRAAKRIEIRTDFEGETLMADARRVEQVLLNLVHNAIKYIPEGRRIQITWRPDSVGGMNLSVKDNGPGIPTEHQARLFERFYRIDTGRSRDQGGTGLGLSIVKHIMIKHGGTVQLVSRLGEGSDFICHFPPVS